MKGKVGFVIEEANLCLIHSTSCWSVLAFFKNPGVWDLNQILNIKPLSSWSSSLGNSFSKHLNKTFVSFRVRSKKILTNDSRFQKKVLKVGPHLKVAMWATVNLTFFKVLQSNGHTLTAVCVKLPLSYMGFFFKS